MSFRLKIILGITVIEMALLLTLLWQGMNFMRASSEQELVRRATTAATLFSTTTKDAVLSSDLASLHSFVTESLRNPELIYARVIDAQGNVLAQDGKQEALMRPFHVDTHIAQVQDGVFDTFAEINSVGTLYGRVELGLSIQSIQQALNDTAQKVSGVVIIELTLVVICAFAFGTYLTRQIANLKSAAVRIAKGDLLHRVKVSGRDEISQVSHAFNLMIDALSDATVKQEQYQFELETLNIDLEKRVNERTAQLTTANDNLNETADALQDNQRILSTLISNLPGMAYRSSNDAQRTMQYISEGSIELSGYAPFQLENNKELSFYELIHPDDKERVEETVKQAAQEGQSFQVTYRITTLDKNEKWVWESGHCIEGRDGSVSIEGFILDVTERVRSEQEAKSRSALQRTYQMVLMGLVKSKPFSAGNINEACRELTQTLVEALVLTRSSIWLMNSSDQQIVCVDLYDKTNQTHSNGMRLSTHDHVDFLHEMENQCGLSVDDVSEHDYLNKFLQSYIDTVDVKSMLATPVYLGGSLYGFVTCEHVGEPRNWTVEENNFVSHIVDMVPLALESDARKLVEESLREAEKKSRGYADELQQRVSELSELNERLEEAHNQLLQSEKMASIGQLAAGVAHEINNPIGFINSNLGTLDEYIKDIFEILDVYESAENQLQHAPDVFQDIQMHKSKVDLSFLKQDIISLMGDSLEGVVRVKQIVQDLKDFSHVDEAEWQWVDIHKGIDSTLNIVNNEIKYKADVVKKYGTLPQIECLASQLNQVFMNLLVNAAHAIEKYGVITISTGSEGDQVWLSISDTGKGIEPEHRSKIFDPFFTTKKIGKGTGLGLSLSYGIIKKHGGRIEVESKVGGGTTFTVWLPVQQSDTYAEAIG